jgi:hypothetical protein
MTSFVCSIIVLVGSGQHGESSVIAACTTQGDMGIFSIAAMAELYMLCVVNNASYPMLCFYWL